MKNSKIFFTWSGSIYGIIGALCVATGYDIVLGYVLFYLSSINWLFVAYIQRDIPLFLMNLVFCTINYIGVYTYIIKVGLNA